MRAVLTIHPTPRHGALTSHSYIRFDLTHGRGRNYLYRVLTSQALRFTRAIKYLAATRQTKPGFAVMDGFIGHHLLSQITKCSTISDKRDYVITPQASTGIDSNVHRMHENNHIPRPTTHSPHVLSSVIHTRTLDWRGGGKSTNLPQLVDPKRSYNNSIVCVPMQMT